MDLSGSNVPQATILTTTLHLQIRAILMQCMCSATHGMCIVRLACAVRKVGYFGPVFPESQGDHGRLTVFPDTGLFRLLLSPKT